MTNQPTSINGESWGLLILLSLLWGGAFFFAGVAVKELPPMTVVLLRVALAAAMLLPVFWMMGHNLPRGFAAWWPFLIMGLLNNALPFGLLFAGQTYVSVGLAAILNALTPLFTVLVMAGFGQERLSWARVAGVLLGVAGVAILTGLDGSNDTPIIGIVLCIAGALSYGFAGLWGRLHLGGVPPVKSATCQLMSSSAIMAIAVGVYDRPWTLEMPGTSAILSIVAMAAFGTALAYLVFFRILVKAGASNVMLVTLMIPVSAMALGNMFLDEPIRVREVLGAGVIGLGLLFIDGRVLGWFRQKKT